MLKFIGGIMKLENVRQTAEGYFDRGEFLLRSRCTHNQRVFRLIFPEEVTKLASGFPIGIGKSGCLCGAVSGGVMALGMSLGRNHGQGMHEDMFPVASELHDHVKKMYGSTCCRVMIKDFVFQSPERKAHCVKITGEVADWVAKKYKPKVLR